MQSTEEYQAAWDDGFRTALEWIESAAKEAALGKGTTLMPPITVQESIKRRANNV